MTGTHIEQAAIEAMLTYAVDTGEKPVAISHQAGGQLSQMRGQLEPQMVAIRNGRMVDRPFDLERHGFRLVDHPTLVEDFYDPVELQEVYYREIETLIGKMTGARRVTIFDHTLRHSDDDVRQARRLREAVRIVHNDYTEWSGPQRVRDLLPAAEAEPLLRRRFAVIQVWRAIGRPVETAPLAICDAQSVAPADLIATERRHADRVGEIYHVAHNAAHRWYYFPKMRRDEALVFKCYDSQTDGRARFTIHSSFDDPGLRDGAPPRESIEARALVFF